MAGPPPPFPSSVTRSLCNSLLGCLRPPPSLFFPLFFFKDSAPFHPTKEREREGGMQPQSSLFRRRNEGAEGSLGGVSGGGYVDYLAAGSTGGPSPFQSSCRAAPPASASPPCGSAAGSRGGSSPLPAAVRGPAAAVQEAENDAMVKALIADVRRARENFEKMGSEVRQQNAFLDALGKAFDQSKGALTRVMTKLEKVSGASSSSHMWALFLFVLVAFMFMYALLKFKR